MPLVNTINYRFDGNVPDSDAATLLEKPDFIVFACTGGLKNIVLKQSLSEKWLKLCGEWGMSFKRKYVTAGS